MSVIKSNLLLLLVAAIWGLAFVAQRVGMEHVGPFTFNGVRFMLGGLSLLPLLFVFRDKTQSLSTEFKDALLPGILAGTVLFIAASLQQIGLVTTTAGKAAFVTSLYLVLVPVLGIFIGQRASASIWLGCMLAMAGLYLLCIKEAAGIQPGDLLELIGALFWAFHILIIGYFSRRVDALKLSWFQTLTCSILSLITAAFTETIVMGSLMAAAVPIVYGGVCSVGIAYTLQIVGQKHAPPAAAAIILSMETVFAVLGGFLLIGETMDVREIMGCALMLSGMLASQLQDLRSNKTEACQHSYQ
ncbi:MAG TPA: EamA family transporter [Syntrophomonas sp.]|nr:EamA family transporter [Syntrophomonas sp.]